MALEGFSVVSVTGEVFQFTGLAAGSISNYAEQTATSYTAAEASANGLFVANVTLLYVVV